jgi:photosystem II stability/assembly factor-like uncharacterized protein
VMFTDTQHGWAVGGLGQVVHTDDGGGHWMQSALACEGHRCYKSTLALAFPDSQNGWLVGQGVFGSKDGDERWVWQDDGIAGEIQDTQIVDKKIGWLATDHAELWYSSNGGKQWHQMDGNTPYTHRGVHFINALHGWSVGDGGTILHYSANRLPIIDELFLPRLKK